MTRCAFLKPTFREARAARSRFGPKGRIAVSQKFPSPQRSGGEGIKNNALLLAAACAILAALILFTPESRAAGSDVYTLRCVICHQPSAQGVPGLYPPLANSIGFDLNLKRGRNYLIQVALNGMTGPVNVNGIIYNGLMPPFAQLPDAEIADVLNYVLTTFNADQLPKDFAPITAHEVKQARFTRDSPAELPRERESLLNELKKAHLNDGASR